MNNIAAEIEVSDFRKLLRVYGVLTGTCDSERTFIGPVSRAWIGAEVEQMIALSSIPRQFFYSNRGREVLAGEFFPGEDIDPQSIDPAALNIPVTGKDIYINSNRLPKLEPTINASILTANILLGVKLYGNKKSRCDISHNWIIAAMLQNALGKRNRYTSFKHEKARIVDYAYILEFFGLSVLEKVQSIKEGMEQFNSALDAGEKCTQIGPEVANSVAAIMVSRLRLSARAVGDSVLSFAGEIQKKELAQNGIYTEVDFAERRFLEDDFRAATAALELEGVDYSTIVEPMRSTLMTAVKDVLSDPDKRIRLSGRRGKAVHDVHMNLPVMEYYVAAESPNALATLHIASLEMMRYLEKGRRKSYSTMLAHALRLTAIAEKTMGRSLEPSIATIALLHDVVEDGSKKVTGYDQSLQKIMFRFGGPIAAMVSEVTDSNKKLDASEKALITLNHPTLMMPQQQYNTGRLNKMSLKATDKNIPYTLAGIIVKLIDTSVSFDEGIRDPDLMAGWWRHSGARIYWAERVRGAIIRPLVERLVMEIQQQGSGKVLDLEARSLLRGGVSLITTMLDYSDLYAAQNLAILADEHGLDNIDRNTMINEFFNPDITVDNFIEKALSEWLTESRLEEQIKAKHVPAKAYVALYPNDKSKQVELDSSTFRRYLKSARRRIQIRRDLGLYTTRKRMALKTKMADVVSLYDYRMSDENASIAQV